MVVISKGKRQAIETLFDSGFGYAEIGRAVGVSRQRAHQIVKKYKSPYHFKNRGQRRLRSV